MQYDCLVCDTSLAYSKTPIRNVFSETNVLPNSSTLLETLQDILSKTLDESNIHSKSLCQECYKTCIDYDGYKSKINTIKMVMSEGYNKTVSSVDKPPSNISVVPISKPKNTIVVPASKLVPIPADFKLNFGKLTQAMSKAKPLSSFNFKVSVGSTAATQTTSTVNVTQPVDSSAATVLSTVSNDITKEWDVNVVPKEIFSVVDDDSQNVTDDDNDAPVTENGDEEENQMEIDEDCSMAIVPIKSEGQNIDDIKSEQQLSDYTDIITLTETDSGQDSGSYLLSNLKMYHSQRTDDDDDEHTIVVNSEDGSILEMVSGQQVIYQNGELSLVVGDRGGDTAGGQGEQGEVSDSNDESQIELQVSGDEETANAIIAAAQEQGGAFIKVESGEMYRVKSVESASSVTQQYDVDSLVTSHGSLYTCNLCAHAGREDEEKNLLEAEAMMQHLKTVHLATLYLCKFCGRGMRKRNEYNKHLAEHSEKQTSKSTKRPHTCSVCGKSYNCSTLLREHMNTHTGARTHTCTTCDKHFATKYTYHAHMKTHQVRPRPFRCGECNKCFLSVQNLKQHEKTHTGVKDFICKVCYKAFGTQHNLEIHGIVHSKERPFVCNYCGKGFSRKADLNDHRRTHTGERPFECDMCGARFAQRSNLHSHKRATHLDDKRHKCTDCPKRFKRRRLLEYHIKATHTGERPLKCEVCSSTFVYPEHYKKHVKIHTGVRPYFCEICGKSFNSRDNRNTHRFTHSEKKPYECLACGNSYMRKRTLIQHMNESGHLAESIVVNQPRVTRVHKDDSGMTKLVEMETEQENQTGDSKVEAVFHTSGKLEALDNPASITKIIADDEGKFFIESECIEQVDESALLEVVDTNGVQIYQNEQTCQDENGSVLRLIQVKLPNGTDGWVALND